MRKLSRRHQENIQKTKNKIYSSLDEAIEILKETSNTKFVESVEFHANLCFHILETVLKLYQLKPNF